MGESVFEGKRSQSKNKQIEPTLELLCTYCMHMYIAMYNMKRQSTEWEKIFVNDVTDKELISRMYKQLKQLNNNNKKVTQSKYGQKT